MRETAGLWGFKIMAFIFFEQPKTRNLMSPDAVYEAPKSSKICFSEGFAPDLRKAHSAPKIS